MKLSSFKKLTFLAILLSSIVFSNSTLAAKDTRYWVKETYEGGGDGAGTLQTGPNPDLVLEDDGKKPQDDGKKPQEEKKPEEIGKTTFQEAKIRVSKVFKMPLEDMRTKFGQEFVDQAILMQMMEMNLGMDSVGRAPSTEEEREFIDANRDAISTLKKKGQTEIITKQDTVTK